MKAKKRGAKPGVARPRSPGGPRCVVCCSPHLHEITSTLARGMSQNAAAKRFGFTQQILWRHCKLHQGAALVEHNLTEPVVHELRRLQRRCDQILAKAEDAEDLPTALKAVHECRENLLGIARLTGEDKSVQKAEPTQVVITYVDRPQVVVERASDTEPNAAIEQAEEGV
jgi:hypothetical protein